eukprot:8828887-Alexandrium_andersonii.AAC.1
MGHLRNGKEANFVDQNDDGVLHPAPEPTDRRSLCRRRVASVAASGRDVPGRLDTLHQLPAQEGGRRQDFIDGNGGRLR